MHFLLLYEVVDGYADKRAPFRPAHLALAQAAVERSELLLGGACAPTEDDAIDGAVLVFTSERAARSFAQGDPYVANGLVTSWRVKSWNTVVGRLLQNDA